MSNNNRDNNAEADSARDYNHPKVIEGKKVDIVKIFINHELFI